MNPRPLISTTLSSAGRRGFVLGFALLYIVSYNLVYMEYLGPIWGYFGFNYQPPSFGYVFSAYLLAVAPAFWMPIRLRRPSQLLYWTLYLIVFIPSMFGPLYMNLRPVREVMQFMLALFCGMVIIGACYFFPLPKLSGKPIPSRVFWTGLACVAILFSLWTLVVFRANMKLVSFEDVYGLRDEAKLAMQGSLIAYALGLMLLLINPLLIAVGLKSGRRWLAAIGVGSHFFIYVCTGQKAALLAIPLTIGVFYLYRRFENSFGIVLCGMIALGMLSMVILNPVADKFHIVQIALGLIVMRTIGTPGMLSGEYHAFFMTHPLTHFTHAKPMSLFVHSPYPLPLGYEVGAFFKSGTGINENAHFWVADGMAAYGLAGILMISVLAALVFWIFDLAASRHNMVLMVTFSIYLAMQLSNASLLTMLGTYGLIPAIAMLFFMPTDGVPRKVVPASRAKLFGPVLLAEPQSQV